MSTLAEIEAAVRGLTLDELRQLEGLLWDLARRRANKAGPFTGREAIAWWRESEHLGATEAESFAMDVEAARSEIEAPVSRWD